MTTLMISSYILAHYQVLTNKANDIEDSRTKYKPIPDDGSLYKRVTDWTRDVAEKSSQRPRTQERACNVQLHDHVDSNAIHSQYCRYREIILGSMAYRWLLSEIGKYIVLDTDNADSMLELRRHLLQALNQPHGSSRNTKPPSEVLHVDILFHWALEPFLRQQFGDKDIRLGNIITLTGRGVDAQALTCSSYLRQTWPCTGLSILGCVQDAFDSIRMRTQEQLEGKSNQTRLLTCHMRIPSFMVFLVFVSLRLSPAGESRTPLKSLKFVVYMFTGRHDLSAD